MKTLTSKEDVQSSIRQGEREERSSYLKIPERVTPWYLLSLDYIDGWVHWVRLPNGERTKVVHIPKDSESPEDDHGWSPETCPICAFLFEKYAEIRDMDLSEDAAKAKRAPYNDMRAKYEAHFIAAKGVRILKEDSKGRKAYVADFDFDDDESDAEVGILSLSHAQYLKIVNMPEGDEDPSVMTGEDLGNRVLWSKKKKQSGKSSQYTEVFWAADKKTSDPPCAIPEGLSIEHDFDVDPEHAAKVYDALTGESSEDVSDDDDVELEGDSEDEDIDDDYLDDVEGEADDSEDEETEGEDDEEGESDDEEFEDDIPWDEDEDDGTETELNMEEDVAEESSTKKSSAPAKKAGTKSSSTRTTKSGGSTKKSAGTSSKSAGTKKAGTSAKKSAGGAGSKAKSTTKRAKTGKASL